MAAVIPTKVGIQRGGRHRTNHFHHSKIMAIMVHNPSQTNPSLQSFQNPSIPSSTTSGKNSACSPIVG